MRPNARRVQRLGPSTSDSGNGLPTMKSVLIGYVVVLFAIRTLFAHENEAAFDAALVRSEALGHMVAPWACGADSLDLAVIAFEGHVVDLALDSQCLPLSAIRRSTRAARTHDDYDSTRCRQTLGLASERHRCHRTRCLNLVIHQGAEDQLRASRRRLGTPSPAPSCTPPPCAPDLGLIPTS